MSTPLKEKELLLRVAGGDEIAFTELFNNYRKKTYTSAVTLTGSDSIAEELVQDIFLKLWVRRSLLANVDNFQGYLFAVTRNEAYQTLRRMSVERKKLGRMINDLGTTENPDDSGSPPYAAILEEAVRRLPDRQKAVYLMAKQEGMKREAIAEKLAIQPNTVKEHLGLAIKSIRAYCLSRISMGISILLVLLRVIRNN